MPAQITTSGADQEKMLGLDNPIHIAFLLVLLLLVFGARRLPEMGKSLGAGMRGFKDSLTGEHVPPTLTPTQAPPADVAGAGPAVADAAAPVTAAAEPRAPSAA